jgi:hypothetical protein
VTDCVHHWLVESPTGEPTVRGKCRKCRAVRAFPMRWDEFEFNAGTRRKSGKASTKQRVFANGGRPTFNGDSE